MFNLSVENYPYIVGLYNTGVKDILLILMILMSGMSRLRWFISDFFQKLRFFTHRFFGRPKFFTEKIKQEGLGDPSNDSSIVSKMFNLFCQDELLSDDERDIGKFQEWGWFV